MWERKGGKEGGEETRKGDKVSLCRKEGNGGREVRRKWEKKGRQRIRIKEGDRKERKISFSAASTTHF